MVLIGKNMSDPKNMRELAFRALALAEKLSEEKEILIERNKNLSRALMISLGCIEDLVDISDNSYMHAKVAGIKKLVMELK